MRYNCSLIVHNQFALQMVFQGSFIVKFVYHKLHLERRFDCLSHLKILEETSSIPYSGLNLSPASPT